MSANDDTPTKDGCERMLARAGVFAGHSGLRGLANADEFWARQEYGTRLYFGGGGMDYLHHSVLRAAVESLDTAHFELSRLTAENEALQKDAARYKLIRDHNWEDRRLSQILFAEAISDWDAMLDYLITAIDSVKP